MTANTQNDSRALVRDRLWSRLDSAGIKPCQKMTQDGYDAMRRRLTPKLAYLGGDLLDVLAAILIDVSANSRGDRCPSEVIIWGQAKGLRPPPLREHEIVTSWLASIEGPAALAGGYAVTLLRWLIQNAPPGPTEFDMRKIRAAAANDMRRVAVLERRERDRNLRDDERDELAGWRRDVARVEGVIADGIARRAQNPETEGSAA